MLLNDFKQLRREVIEHFNEYIKQDLDTRVHYLEEAVLSPRYGATQIGTHEHWKLISPDGVSHNPVVATDDSGYMHFYNGDTTDSRFIFEGGDWYILMGEEYYDSGGWNDHGVYINMYQWSDNFAQFNVESVDVVWFARYQFDIYTYEGDITLWPGLDDGIGSIYCIGKLLNELDTELWWHLECWGNVGVGSKTTGGTITAGNHRQAVYVTPTVSVLDAIGNVRIFDDTNLGAEIHTQSNAAAPAGGSEAEATTGWTNVGGTLTADDTWSPVGTWSIMLTSTGGANYMEYAFTAVVGTMYKIHFRLKSSSSVQELIVGYWTNLEAYNKVRGWVRANEAYNDDIYVVATGTAAKMRFYARETDDITKIDDVSIRAVLPGGGNLSVGGTITATNLNVTGALEATVLDIICHNNQVVCHNDNVIYLN